MANQTPETIPDIPALSLDETPWNCKIDGHEFKTMGEYDPDTGCYPYLECSHCGATAPWEGDSEQFDEENDRDTVDYDPEF